MTSRARTLAAWFILVALGALLFVDTVGGAFVGSDYTFVRALAERGPFALWTHADRLGGDAFRPLASFDLWLDWRLFHQHAAGYRVANLLLHLGAALLVGHIGGLLFADRRLGAAAALAFLAMPAHVEAVAWTSSRPQLLGALFGLGAVAAWLGHVAGKPGRAPLTLLLLALGLLSHEAVAAVPLALLLHALFLPGSPGPGGRRDAGARRRGLTLAALGLGLELPWLVVRRLAIGAGGDDDSHDAAANLVNAVAHLFGYGGPGFGVAGKVVTLVLLLALGAIFTVAIVAQSLRQPMPAMPQVAWLLAALVLTILPVVDLAYDHAGSGGERHLYLASAFAALTLVALARPLPPSLPRLGAFALWLLAAAASLRLRARDWRQASQIARQVVDDLAAAPHRDAVYVLALPGDLRDAPIFVSDAFAGGASALPDALALLARDAAPVYVLATQHLGAATHPTHVSRLGDELTLTLPAAGDDRLAYGGATTSTYTLDEQQPKSLRARFFATGSWSAYAFAYDHLRLAHDEP